MAENTPSPPLERTFEQGPDAVSFYCDFTQILGTENELVLQFYETIPGAPGPDGIVRTIKSRLRATITFSHEHALRIAEAIQQRRQAKVSQSGGES